MENCAVALDLKEQGEVVMDKRVRAGDMREDQFTAMLEARSAELPSSLFLGLAIASILGSLGFKLAGKDRHAMFLGQWAAPFLLLGIYNKMVKQHGSDAAAKWQFHGGEHEI
jgi:hypothetical protein